MDSLTGSATGKSLCVCQSGVMMFTSLVICLFFWSGGKHEREGLLVLAVWLVTFGVSVHFFIFLGVSTELFLMFFSTPNFTLAIQSFTILLVLPYLQEEQTVLMQIFYGIAHALSSCVECNFCAEDIRHMFRKMG